MGRLLLLLIFVQALTWGKAQSPSRFFSKIGGEGEDIGYSGKITLDDNYIIAGLSSSYGTHGNTDAYIVKLNSFGTISWTKFIGGIGNDAAKSVIQLADSGFVFTGYTTSLGAGGYDMYLVRMDKQGNVLWERTFGGTEWDFGQDVVLAYNNKLYVVGKTLSMGKGGYDGFVVEYDLNGNKGNHYFFGSAGEDDLRSIINTQDSCLMAVGQNALRDTDGDIFAVKFKYNGDTVFTKYIGGPYLDFANDVVQTKGLDDDYTLVGKKTYSLDVPGFSYYVRMNKNGVVQKDTNFQRNKSEEEASSVCNSYARRYFVAMARTPNFKGGKGRQEEVIVLWPDAHEQFINDSGLESDEAVFSIEPTKDGGYFSVGYTSSFSSTGRDIYYIKRDTLNLPYQNEVGLEEKVNGYYFFIANKQITFPTKDVSHLTLWSIDGKQICDLDENDLSASVSLGNLESGVYILSLSSRSGERITKKLLIE
jgi:hypothetical protein